MFRSEFGIQLLSIINNRMIKLHTRSAGARSTRLKSSRRASSQSRRTLFQRRSPVLSTRCRRDRSAQCQDRAPMCTKRVTMRAQSDVAAKLKAMRATATNRKGRTAMTNRCSSSNLKPKSYHCSAHVDSVLLASRIQIGSHSTRAQVPSKSGLTSKAYKRMG